ncbi:MAG: rubredoxin [Candidatus Hodarchaeales archaeon]
MSKRHECTVCGWNYIQRIGDPISGIPGGTPFEELPEDWICPVCGIGKEVFVLVTEKKHDVGKKVLKNQKN